MALKSSVSHASPRPYQPAFKYGVTIIITFLWVISFFQGLSSHGSPVVSSLGSPQGMSLLWLWAQFMQLAWSVCSSSWRWAPYCHSPHTMFLASSSLLWMRGVLTSCQEPRTLLISLMRPQLLPQRRRGNGSLHSVTSSKQNVCVLSSGVILILLTFFQWLYVVALDASLLISSLCSL